MKSLSRSSFLKSKQYYVDILLLIFQPLPYWDPTFIMRCINISDKTEFLDIEYKISKYLAVLMTLNRHCLDFHNVLEVPLHPPHSIQLLYLHRLTCQEVNVKPPKV